MHKEFQKIAEIRQEIARCDWNLDRINFPDGTFNDYDGSWAAHHMYFKYERLNLSQTLKYALALPVMVQNQGIGL